jgi:putative transposase
MRDDLQADLVLDALGMAVTARGAACAGVVDHSDLGQFTSPRYGLYANQSQIELPMGSVGDPWGDAIAETLFASLENELLQTSRRSRYSCLGWRGWMVLRRIRWPDSPGGWCRFGRRRCEWRTGVPAQ